MNRNVTIIVLVLLIGITAFVFYIRAHTPKYKWEVNYTKKSIEPYGLKYIYDLLKKQKEEVNVLSNESFEMLDTSQANSNLIAIDYYFELDSLNISYLLDYVKKGNKAFFSSEEAPINLLDRIFSSGDSLYDYQSYDLSTIDVSFASSNLPYPERMKFNYRYLKLIKPRSWFGYKVVDFDEVFKGKGVTPISYLNDSIVSCFYVQYGKGAIIIHSNPIVFTNYNMIQKTGFKHASNLFSYMNNGSIYWCELNSYTNETTTSEHKNPLKFLFSHYTLKTGWYVFLTSILIFILFRSKREQRIIPILYKNKNTSIEYAKAIGSLYYQKKAHRNIANEMYNSFLSDLRTRYNIVVSANEQDLVEQICKRTEIKKEVIVDLFSLFSEIRNGAKTTSKQLVKLYQAIDNFNKIKK